MKRILIIAFLNLYLLSLVGLSVNVHHCAGQISYQIFGLSTNNGCDCDHQNKNHTSSCCHNEQIEIKSIDNNQMASSTCLAKNNWIFILEPYLTFNCEINNSITLFKKVIKPEYPPRYSPPIYILNGVFLI